MLIPTKINKNAIKNSAAMKKLNKITSSNVYISFVVKTVLMIILWACALVPTWLYLLVRWSIGPATFWQDFAIFVVAAVVAGWLQVLLAIFGFIITFIILFEDV